MEKENTDSGSEYVDIYSSSTSLQNEVSELCKKKKILEDIRNLKPELHKLKDEGSTDESSSVSARSVVKSLKV